MPSTEELMIEMFSKRSQIKELEEEVASIRKELYVQFPDGVKSLTEGDYILNVRLPSIAQQLRITDKSSVPSAFLTALPDRKKIAESITAGGEIPEGCGLAENLFYVQVKSLNNPDDANTEDQNREELRRDYEAIRNATPHYLLRPMSTPWGY